MADLFALTDLAIWLDTDLQTDLATLVRSKVTAMVGAELGRVPDPVPAGLSAVAVGIAARIYDNPTGYKAESFAGYSASYGDATLTADEKAALRVFSRAGGRRLVASSPMVSADFGGSTLWYQSVSPQSSAPSSFDGGSP